MTRLTLKRRVEELESQVAQLRDDLQAVGSGKHKDWRRTIGAFTDDEGLKQILREAMRLREADRKKSRSRQAAKRSVNR